MTGGFAKKVQRGASDVSEEWPGGADEETGSGGVDIGWKAVGEAGAFASEDVGLVPRSWAFVF